MGVGGGFNFLIGIGLADGGGAWEWGDDETGANVFGAFAVVGWPGLDIAGDVCVVAVCGPAFADFFDLVRRGEMEAKDVEATCFEVVGDELEVGACVVFGEEVFEG